MTKQTKLTIIIAALFILVLGVCVYAANIKPIDSDSKKIADLEYRMNELRKGKEACFNALTYTESIDAYNLKTKPCVERDEEIMSLREQADALKAKSYEGLR